MGAGPLAAPTASAKSSGQVPCTSHPPQTPGSDGAVALGSPQRAGEGVGMGSSASSAAESRAGPRHPGTCSSHACPPLPWFYPLSCTETVVINWAAHFFSLVSICLAFNLSGKENPPFLEAFLPFSIT